MGMTVRRVTIGKVTIGIGRVTIVRVTMGCSRLLHNKLTCSQFSGTCFSLREIFVFISDVKDFGLETNLVFLSSPSFPKLGHRYKARQGLLKIRRYN